MPHPAHPNMVSDAVQALSDHGFDGIAQAIELLITECIRADPFARPQSAI